MSSPPPTITTEPSLSERVLPRWSHLDALRDRLSSVAMGSAEEELAGRPENTYEDQQGAGRARGMSGSLRLRLSASKCLSVSRSLS